MNTLPKLNLVYIASIGRSGTTLFESILGAHSMLETVGEVHIWPHEIREGGVRPCGSGLYVQEDPFWLEMERRVDPLNQPAPRIDYFREAHTHGKTLRPSQIAALRSGPVSKQQQEKIDQYGRNNYEMFRTFSDLVEENTGSRPKWLVDASKDPYRLLWLIRSGLFNIKVIQMVKNPPAFIYSVTKEWIRSQDPLRLPKRLYYTSRQSLAWVLQNRLFSAITSRHVAPSDTTLIKYEQLATHPHETTRAACELIGVPYEPEAVDNFREGCPFTIAGNPMRYESGGIRLDEKWKRLLPSSSRLLASLIAGRSSARYGY